MKTIKPVGKNILLKATDFQSEFKKRTGTDLIIPDTAKSGSTFLSEGTVLRVGDTVNVAKQGDILAFGRHCVAGVNKRYSPTGEDDLLMIKESDIVGIVEEGN